jgi:ADP-ribosylglycohydrolase
MTMEAHMPRDRDPALKRALLALDGLSIGDALGERFFGHPRQVLDRIADRVVPPGPWRWTDDTAMALSVVETLAEHGSIDADDLARRFAARYADEPGRGYGGGAHQLLQVIGRGVPWQQAAPAMFGGSGSFGNGGAMRVAPLGGYFADDLDRLVEEAGRSAAVTHAHPEGIAGAVATAVAAAVAWRQAERGLLDGASLLAAALERTPAGETRDRLAEASRLPGDLATGAVAERLGSGQRVSAQDTVPFALWCAARHLGDFEETFWTTVLGLGDRDTTCAIACGVAALAARGVPEEWRRAREALPLALASRSE